MPVTNAVTSIQLLMLSTSRLLEIAGIMTASAFPAVHRPEEEPAVL